MQEFTRFMRSYFEYFRGEIGGLHAPIVFASTQTSVDCSPKLFGSNKLGSRAKVLHSDTWWRVAMHKLLFNFHIRWKHGSEAEEAICHWHKSISILAVYNEIITCLRGKAYQTATTIVE